MSAPDWLSEAGSVWDQEGERWVIRSVGADWVELGHPDRGRHRIQRSDLVEWVENGDWSRSE